jgi:hypothetical protein
MEVLPNQESTASDQVLLLFSKLRATIDITIHIITKIDKMILFSQLIPQLKRMIPPLNQFSQHALLEMLRWFLVLTASKRSQLRCAQETWHQLFKKVRNKHVSSGQTVKRLSLMEVLLNQE